MALHSSPSRLRTGTGVLRAAAGSAASVLVAAVCLVILSGCVPPIPIPGGVPVVTVSTTVPSSPPTSTPGGAPGAGSSIARYDIGTPTLTDVWLDPISGDDARSGSDRAHALRSLGAAWARVPADLGAAPTGIRIRITPGTVPFGSLANNWFEAKHGTAQHPIMIESADGRGSVTIDGGMNILDVDYLYLTGLRFPAGGPAPSATDTIVHGDQVDHFVLRQSDLIGDRGGAADMKEGLKINQSQYVFVEDSDISGGWDNPIDFVAVQYGHAIGNRVHHGGDWCMYAKGGSAFLVIDGNEFFSCGTGGFTAGQGTGFEWMRAPFLTYETMGIEFTNNLVHDVEGAGFGTNGGYNILFAYNTVYRAGSRSHTIEVMHGNRNCDGDTATCAAHNAAGGWGPPGAGEDTQFIPARHISIVNNIIANPRGFVSAQQFSIASPTTPPAGWNVAGPAVVDADLRIAGNVIWNGGTDTPLGIEDTGACIASNPTCNAAQLRRDNAINTIEPLFLDAAGGNFHLVAPILGRAGAVPPVVWGDVPSRPDSHGLVWIRSDAVSHDRAGGSRALPGIPGAY